MAEAGYATVANEQELRAELNKIHASHGVVTVHLTSSFSGARSSVFLRSDQDLQGCEHNIQALFRESPTRQIGLRKM